MNERFQSDMVKDAVTQILTGIGEDPTRDGLLMTPDRVSRSFSELTSGYGMDPAKILKTSFESDGYDEMVVLREIDFFSLCEHHMLPFYGTATIVYIPSGKVVGISKLARLVECFARRLQIQERMTKQIADAVQEYLVPRGYGVAIKARHLCMAARGVGKQRSEMVTHAVGGLIKEDPKARQEFTQLAAI